MLNFDSTPRVPGDNKPNRREERFRVSAPAYVSKVDDVPWSAKGELSDLSARGLMMTLLGPPPFGEGTQVKVEWLDVSVIGEVRHLTCRPGLVSMGVRIDAVQHGSVLSCVAAQQQRTGAAIAESPRARLAETQSRLFLTVPALQPLLASVRQRSDKLFQHAVRVGEYAIAIASGARLSVAEFDTIWMAAVLHDVGKIALPDSAIVGENLMTKQQKQEMRSHVGIGAALLSSIPQLQPVAEIVRHQDERWDGQGGPSGLKGIAVPLGARIIAIADAFDVTAANVSGVSARRTTELITSQSGRQFDPNLVGIFVDYVNQQIRPASSDTVTGKSAWWPPLSSL